MTLNLRDTITLLSLFVLFFLLLTAEPVLAGPGGKIAKSLFDSLWGKLLLIALIIVFLPLIVLNFFKERWAERRTRRDLRFMSKYNSNFEWLFLKQRITDCFNRIHRAWQQEELEQVSEWMTSWYWQNQQSLVLDEWAQKDLVNICKVKTINNIKPLLFIHRNPDSDHNDSMLVASISARMQDYLMERKSEAIIEGNKKYHEVEKIWTFTLVDGLWKVSNIEEPEMTADYLKMISELPKIEDTLLEKELR